MRAPLDIPAHVIQAGRRKPARVYTLSSGGLFTRSARCATPTRELIVPMRYGRNVRDDVPGNRVAQSARQGASTILTSNWASVAARGLARYACHQVPAPGRPARAEDFRPRRRQHHGAPRQSGGGVEARLRTRSRCRRAARRRRQRPA
jgi:hypothetical protein